MGLADCFSLAGTQRLHMQDVNLRQVFEAFCEIYEPARELMATGTPLGELKGAPLRCSLDGALYSRAGMLATGEAIGSTYDFSGEGIGKAMQTGMLAAASVIKGREQTLADAAVRADYEEGLRALQPRFELYRKASRVNAHPWLADLVIWRARKSQRILRRMSGVLEETANPGNLVSVRGIAKLFLPFAKRAMCQLLGMNANTPTDVMFSFTGLATRADEHKDGFGIAFFEHKGLRLFVDPASAIDSPVADMVRRYPIKSGNVIAHIRKATQGHVALENCHPFVRELWGRYWVFAHNGDLKDFHPRLHGAFRPVGDTDSERAFCWLMQELAKAHASVPTVAELSTTLRELLPVLRAHGSFNMLLSNGQALWAHGATQLHWLQRQHPFRPATLADDDLSVDFAALTSPADRVAVVATQPLTTGEQWMPIAPGELMVFVDGAPLQPALA